MDYFLPFCVTLSYYISLHSIAVCANLFYSIVFSKYSAATDCPQTALEAKSVITLKSCSTLLADVTNRSIFTSVTSQQIAMACKLCVCMLTRYSTFFCNNVIRIKLQIADVDILCLDYGKRKKMVKRSA